MKSFDRDDAEKVLAESVRPAIRGHAGDIHIVAVSALGEITVEFSGACRVDGCLNALHSGGTPRFLLGRDGLA